MHKFHSFRLRINPQWLSEPRRLWTSVPWRVACELVSLMCSRTISILRNKDVQIALCMIIHLELLHINEKQRRGEKTYMRILCDFDRLSPVPPGGGADHNRGLPTALENPWRQALTWLPNEDTYLSVFKSVGLTLHRMCCTISAGASLRFLRSVNCEQTDRNLCFASHFEAV